MQKRAVRLTLLALLVAAFAGAGYVTWDATRRIAAGLDTERAIDVLLDRMMANVGALGAAQQAYVAPGQAHGEWLTRVSSLLQQLYDDTTASRSRARSPAAAPALRAFDTSLDAFVKTDTRAREHLQTGQELMASDLVFSEGRDSLAAMVAQLRQMQSAEHAVASADRKQLITLAAQALGAAGLVALLVALALVPTPKRETASVAPAMDPRTPTSRLKAAPADVKKFAPVDLTAAADVCTALSRMTAARELPELLGRAAAVLDASGIIVWLGAGEELFAAAAYGYGAKVIARLGPIARNAENATAAAWRLGELRTVPGDVVAHGASGGPLFGPAGSVGVLAAEVRNGREADEATRAVTAMFAAQLAAIVAAWPAPSGVASRVEGPAPSAIEAPVEGPAADGL